ARDRTRLAQRFAVRRLDRYLRGRQGRLRPGRRRRLHPAECATLAHRRKEGTQIRLALAILGFHCLAASAAPVAISLGDVRVGLDTPSGFADSVPTGSPRLQELAEALTSASNRILMFAIPDGDLRRFTVGDAIEAKRYMVAVTPRGLERDRISASAFNTFVNDSLRGQGAPPPAGTAD